MIKKVWQEEPKKVGVYRFCIFVDIQFSRHFLFEN